MLGYCRNGREHDTAALSADGAPWTPDASGRPFATWHVCRVCGAALRPVVIVDPSAPVRRPAPVLEALRAANTNLRVVA